MDPIVVQDSGEEPGERWHHPSVNTMKEKGVYRPGRVPLLYGVGPDQGPPVFAGLGRGPWKHGDEIRVLGEGAV